MRRTTNRSSERTNSSRAISLVTPNEMIARWKKPLIWRNLDPVSGLANTREKRSERRS